MAKKRTKTCTSRLLFRPHIKRASFRQGPRICILALDQLISHSQEDIGSSLLVFHYLTSKLIFVLISLSISNDDLNFSYYRRESGEPGIRTPPRKFSKGLNEECLIEERELEDGSVLASLSEDSSVGEKKSSINLGREPTTAPAIDFKLDVRIEINSGKCVLHAGKQTGGKSDSANSSRVDPFIFNSELQKTNMMRAFAEPETRNTNFIFPAIRVKSFYESTHRRIQHRLRKKANLYAMIKIDSFVMPSFSSSILTSRDMCISSAFLDFLEQSLEPLNQLKPPLGLTPSPAATTPGPQSTASRDIPRNDSEGQKVLRIETDLKEFKKNLDAGKESRAEQEASYFPIEVVVFVSMLPSCIRFTCLPQSTMECLLKLPTLELVFSTYKIDSQKQSLLYDRLNSDEPAENNSKQESKPYLRLI